VSLCAAASCWFFWQPGVFYNVGAAGAALVALPYGARAAMRDAGVVYTSLCATADGMQEHAARQL